MPPVDVVVLSAARTPIGRYGGSFKDVHPAELGALIRDHRTRLRLDQKSLADKAGVSRQWIVDVEKGKPGAPVGLVLSTIGVLGIALDADRFDDRAHR